MELGVSALTRRDRLERIAGAERDRRAGRIEVAIAALGEPTEWAARVVLALARLPEGEGARTRAILEEGLDTWAAELGLAALDPDAVGEEATDAAVALEAEDAEIDAVPDPSDFDRADAVPDPSDFDRADAPGNDRTMDLVMAPPVVVPPTSPSALAAPIESDELERAFAEAEAQTEEMHDVNRVAERVLMDEPLGLAELSGEAIEETQPPAEPEVAATPGSTELPIVDRDPYDISASELQIGLDPEEMGEGTVDAAWAEAPIWPEPTPESDVPTTLVEGGSVEGGGGGAAEHAEAADADRDEGAPRRGQVLATLERWLGNLETRRGRAR